MKRSKKVKIFKEELRFFIDKGAKDEMDENTFCRVVLYGNDGEKWYWNLESEPKILTASDVRKAFMERKFKRA